MPHHTSAFVSGCKPGYQGAMTAFSSKVDSGSREENASN